jgi:hypothetical protein
MLGAHHVALAAPAGSEPGLRAFYGGLLGLPELPKPPELAARGGCWFLAGALELHLGTEAGFRPARKAHPGLLVSDIDALARLLTDAGVAFRWDAALPEHRRLHTHDPVGNRLEFLQPVALRQGADERACAP